MKKITGLTLSAVFLITVACNNNRDNASDHKDSMEQAEQANDAKNINEDDSKFVIKAAEGGMMEVESSKIAAEHAVNPDVKSFAQKMVEDHSKANSELKALAESKKITIPIALTEDTKESLYKLGKEAGSDFDKKYMDMMVDAHNTDVDMFEDASKNSKDADIKSFAAKTLPTLQMHKDMAKKTHDMIKDQKDTKVKSSK